MLRCGVSWVKRLRFWLNWGNGGGREIGYLGGFGIFPQIKITRRLNFYFSCGNNLDFEFFD